MEVGVSGLMMMRHAPTLVVGGQKRNPGCATILPQPMVDFNAVGPILKLWIVALSPAQVGI